MKRRLLALMLLSCLLLTGCHSRMAFMISHSKRSEDACSQLLTRFTTALETRDAAALKALFSPKVQASCDLDTPIRELLALTEGRTLRAEWDGLNSSGATRSRTEHSEHASFRIDLYIDGTPYFVHLDQIYRHQEEPDAVGATRIALYSDYLYISESFTSPAGDGMFVHAYTGADYQTRRINNYPHIWTEIERTIPEAELCAVLRANPTLAAVQQAFGEPNAHDIGYVYQLADENGEARYATLYFNNDGTLQSVSLDSGTDWLRNLYPPEESGENRP